MKKYNVAVVGATGMVGREMIEILEEREFPVDNIKFLASHRSKGKEMEFKDETVIVEELKEDSLDDVDIALFSAGSGVSKKFAPIAADSGTVVIDNSSAFRMDEGVPLIVPEVNPEEISDHNGIIANPNCSTIQLVVVLDAIREVVNIERVVVATYQSVSGWGKAAVNQLWEEVEELFSDYKKEEQEIYKVKDYNADKPIPYQIGFNLVPHIDKFQEADYTKEEWKMVNETSKILDEDIKLTSTCVRAPVIRAHAEVVNLEIDEELEIEDTKRILNGTDGVQVVDDPSNEYYPLPADAAGKDGIYVGRIRKDKTVEHGLNLWIVSDNLRKGAALNTIQIAELLVHK